MQYEQPQAVLALLRRHGIDPIPAWRWGIGLQIKASLNIDFCRVHILNHCSDGIKNLYGLVPFLFFIELKTSMKVINGLLVYGIDSPFTQ